MVCELGNHKGFITWPRHALQAQVCTHTCAPSFNTQMWLSELLSAADPAPGLDREIKLAAALRRAEGLAARGALGAAADAAAAAFQAAARAGMQVGAAPLLPAASCLPWRHRSPLQGDSPVSTTIIPARYQYPCKHT